MTTARLEHSAGFLIILMLVFVSTILMLRSSSAELSWDEADYANSSVNNGWKYLWSHSDYSRHNHGPLAIYLAKLGNDYLSVSVGSLEDRLRLPAAVFGSLAIGLTYWALRYTSEHHYQQQFWVRVCCYLVSFASKKRILSDLTIRCYSSRSLS